jgi:hypothetical protein
MWGGQVYLYLYEEATTFTLYNGTGKEKRSRNGETKSTEWVELQATCPHWPRYSAVRQGKHGMLVYDQHPSGTTRWV